MTHLLIINDGALQKEIKYFWGYQNFILSDALFKLPILEETKETNIVGSKVITLSLNLLKLNSGVRGLRAVSNHRTIAHITVLLVALTAAKTGNKDKICFVKIIPS